jgi:hypothetical protein
VIVTPIPPTAIDLVLGNPPRPKGLHLSSIIKDLLVSIDPDRYGQPLHESKVLTGLAFERVLEQGFGAVAADSFRPDPVQKDGIWCSPDHMGTDPWRVKEFKLTWYSAAKECPGDDVYWPWLVQVKAYDYAMETNLAELWVFHVNGDYKPPRPPERPLVLGLEFTTLELQENWAMLVGHAKAKGWL